MQSRLIALTFSVVVLLGLGGTAYANPMIFSDNLTSNSLGGELSEYTAAGFGINLTNTGAEFLKQSGIGNGYAEIKSNFTFSGNFTLTVHVDNDGIRNHMSHGEAGLAVTDATTGSPVLTSIFHSATSVYGVDGTCCAEYPTQFASNFDCCFTLKIAGGEPITGLGGSILSPPASDPLYFTLFLINESNISSSNNMATFTDITLSADTINSVPEPSSGQLFCSGVIIMGLLRFRCKMSKIGAKLPRHRFRIMLSLRNRRRYHG